MNKLLIAILILGFIFAVIAGCSNGTGDDSPRNDGSSDDDDQTPDDDDDDDDDDNDNDDDDDDNDDDDNDDDDDDNDNDNDDDDDDDDNSESLIFLPFDRYYFSELWLSVSPEILTPGNRLVLDGVDIDPVKLQKVTPADGAHTLEFIGSDSYQVKQFEIITDETTAYPICQGALSASPLSFSLPETQGQGAPIRITITNTGDQTATDLGFSTPGQPDFKTVPALSQYLATETAGMTWHEKAMFLLDFLAQWVDTFPPPFYSADDDNLMPDILRSWGYGYCGEQAFLMGYLAWLIEDADRDSNGWYFGDGFSEYPQTAIRAIALTGHVTLELHYDGQWHMFDPSTYSVYFDDTGKILAASEIETTPALIMDFTDQDGQSLGGKGMEDMVDVYGSTENNSYHAISLPNYEGRPGGFNLDPGETLTLYPLGFGVFFFGCTPGHEADCGYPGTTGTAVIKTTVTAPAIGELSAMTQVYPIVGINVVAMAQSSGQLEFALSCTGTQGTIDESFTAFVEPGDNRVDLSHLLDFEAAGIIFDVTLDLTSTTASLDQIEIETVLQFNPRAIPGLTHDQRELVVVGQGDTTLDITVDAYDKVETVVETYFFADYQGDPVSVPSDGKALARVQIALLDDTQTNDGGWAAGHKIEVVSDHPAQIEILTSPRTGYNRFNPVPSNWSGIDPLALWGDVRLMPFYARSRENYPTAIGTVTFQLVVDDVPQAETVQVDFE